MNCLSHQCKQGRRPCTNQACHESPVGGPWDWIEELIDRMALIAIAIAIVAAALMAYRFFK